MDIANRKNILKKLILSYEIEVHRLNCIIEQLTIKEDKEQAYIDKYEIVGKLEKCRELLKLEY